MISQILGAVMLIYLLGAILFLMAELWSSARLQGLGRITLWLGLGLHTGALLGRWWDPTTWPWATPRPRRGPKNCNLSLFRSRSPTSMNP